MKRCMFGFVFLLAASLCFAQITGNVELYGGAALFNETSRLNGPNTNYASVSVSGGLSGGIYFNDFIRLKAYLDFLIPLSFTASPDGGTKITREEYGFLLGNGRVFWRCFQCG